MGYAPPVTSPPFSRLAEVYDEIMADVDYDDWLDFLLREARNRGAPEGRILDLACGTGNATAPALVRGLDVDGLDASNAMLAVARAKLPGVVFHQADARSFELPHHYALVYSVFDALNNLLDDRSFLATARSVRAHLVPGGVFAFDANTTQGLRQLWVDGRAEGWAGEVYYRWTHHYDDARALATVEAYCDGPEGDFTEVHHEKPYDPADLERLLHEAGFGRVDVVRYPSGERATHEDERVWAFATVEPRA